MPEEAKENKPQSWWQSLPGILTALAAILTAATGLFVALSQSGFLHKSEPTGTTTFTGSPVALKGSVSSISFPLSEVRIVDTFGTSDRDLAYKILSASLTRSTQVHGFLTITFMIRVTNNGQGYTSVDARFFRLLADADSVASESTTPADVFGGASARAILTFSFPETTKNAQLQVGEIDQKTARIPLALKFVPPN